MLPTTPSPRPSDPGFATGTVTRREIEAREDAQLAPYAMRSQDSAGRVHDEPEHDYRTAYMRDRDRIIHASAFRKLEYKTQVFVNHEGDYYRTRLTHTMEVAQIARTAARALRLNEDLTESIALDITPVARGCELDALAVGGEVVLAGFGEDEAGEDGAPALIVAGNPQWRDLYREIV